MNTQYKDVMESKARFKEWFLKMLTSNCILSTALLLSIALNICLIAFEKDPRLIAITDDLRVMELPPLDEPYLTDAKLGQFVADTLPEAASLDFDKYLKTLNRIQDRFAPEAYKSFLSLLKNNGWLAAVSEKHLLLRCAITAPPLVVKRWTQSGRKTWEIQAPCAISLHSTNAIVFNKAYTAHIILQRCSLKENSRGVWIKVIQII